MTKKIKINPTSFQHHRSGWKPVSEFIYQQLNSNQGVVLYDWADRVFKDKTIVVHPWIGIFHNVINYPQNEYKIKYSHRIHPLSLLVHLDHFKKSLLSCKGIFTLSVNTANYLKMFVNCEVCPLVHPILPVAKTFNWTMYGANKKLVTIGQWLRRYHSICELNTDHKKILLKTAGFDADYIEMEQYSKCANVEMRKPMSNHHYDNLLSSAAVFLDLYDVAACNVILECIIRNTPILVNRLPAAVEYLGEDYPLYYENLEEAAAKLVNAKEAHTYLTNMDKSKFSLEYFLEAMTKSRIYQEL